MQLLVGAFELNNQETSTIFLEILIAFTCYLTCLNIAYSNTRKSVTWIKYNVVLRKQWCSMFQGTETDTSQNISRVSLITRDHSFITYATFSEKLTFLTPWYAHARKFSTLCPSPLIPFCWGGRGWTSYQIFRKGGLDRVSIFRRGLLEMKEVTFFRDICSSFSWRGWYPVAHYEPLRDRLQTLLLILSEFKRIF